MIQMMKRTSIYTLLLLSALFIGCKEQEVETFHAERGINFVNYSTYSREFSDDYEHLEAEVNFFTKYAGKTGWDIQPDTIYAGLQIEGTLPDTLVRVKLKVMPVSGYELPDISVPDYVDLHTGQYQASFRIVCQKPKDYDKHYKAQILVDYANSDVVPGTAERQAYTVTVCDSTAWNDIRVTDEADFNKSYGKYLGSYGPVKTRFLFVTFGQSGPVGGTYSVICDQVFYYSKQGWGGFANAYYQSFIKSALDSYNQTAGSPLAEPDGTLVKFNF